MITIDFDNPSQVIVACVIYLIFAAVNYCLGSSDWQAKVKDWSDNIAFLAVILLFLTAIVLGVNFLKLLFTTL